MDNENTASIERIKAKLAELQELDPDYQIFGSSSHRYRPGSPLTASELVVCESNFGVRLPAGYRDFVMQIGNGGVGPFYGLFQLGGFDMENPTDPDQIKKSFRWTEATNPAQWQSSGPNDGALIMREGEEGESYLEWWIIPGVLYICNYGCAIRFFLVVNGPQAGEVWIDRQAEDKGIIPERGEDGSRLHFLQWYERWLDDGISKLRKKSSIAKDFDWAQITGYSEK